MKKADMSKRWRRTASGVCISVLLAAGQLAGCGQENEAQQPAAEEAQQSYEPQSSVAQETEEILSEEEEASQPEEIAGEYDFTVCFAGDINLSENAGTTARLNESENGVFDCISPELVEYMQSADIMCLNNEFTYSTRGKWLAGKKYAFRADPSRVNVLKDLGVDVVSLANNHVYDYGKDSILDTFSTLQEAGIPYMGAGYTLEEAMAPVCLEQDGKIIAFVGASRAEKNLFTPQATDTEPGILRCYDPTLFLQVIEEAREHADFVIAFVHWGTEYSFRLEQVQIDTGKEYLDAGADVIIGAHSHCLQGMEYYDGKPIVYSLGNYWFNGKTLDSELMWLHFYGNDEEKHLELKVIPAVQSGYRTAYAADADEQERIFSFLEEISVNVEIAADGTVSEKQQTEPAGDDT